MKKILVIGAGGMLGHQMWARLNKAFPGQVYGTVRKPQGSYRKYLVLDEEKLFFNVDVSRFLELEKLLDLEKPDWVINCVGLTLRKPDLEDMTKCIEVNSMLPHRLQIWAQKNDAKIIHFSTDCVFDGKKGRYTELDIPTAEDLYGKSKFLGEISGPAALTLRLSIIGRELEGKTELVEWFLSQNGQTVRGFTKAIYSGMTTIQVAKEVERIIAKHPNLNGLFQVSAPPISKYDLLQLLKEKFHLNIQIEKFEDYKADKSLLCDNYQEKTGFVPPKWEDMIQELAQDVLVKYEV